MLAYFSRKSQHLMQAALRLPEPVIDRALLVTMGLTFLTLAGFAVYYYVDRYYRPVDRIENQVLRQLEAQVVQDPQNPEARIQVAWAYLDQGLVDQAIAQFDAALTLRENYQAALIGKGNAFMRKGDPNAALVSFEQVAELNKGNPYKKTLKELQSVYYYLGTIYAEQKRDEQAIAAFSDALDIDRADADSMYGLGTVYLSQGNLEEARLLLERAVRFDPVFLDGYHGLKSVYEQLGMVGHALMARGMLSYIGGNHDDAVGLLKQAVGVTPDLPEAYQALGLAYEKKGQRAEALQAFQSALDRDPTLLLAQAGVGRLAP